MNNSNSAKPHHTKTQLNHIINIKKISQILGILLWVESGLLLLCMCVSLYYNETSYKAFLYTFGINIIVGGLLMLYGKGAHNRVTRRDGYCIVSLTWILSSLSGMLPFMLSGEIPTAANAFFETMSGFTTTGATILNDIESLSHGMLFWRSLIQWIGGLGMVCFTIAILPIFGGSNQQLFSAEATGVTHDKIHPKISVMTKWIWTIYTILTVTLIILLLIGGMDLFDAICHAFCTTATGGYSTKQASVAHWNSPFIEYVISIFMILSSINFSLYFACMKGNFKRLFRDSEVKWFLGSITVITVLITIGLIYQRGYDIESAFRKALFQVTSIHTSCGFATDDYNLWPTYTWMLLLFAMISGGCTGSTGGGVKNMRIMILYYNIVNEFKRLIHPNAVLPIRINRHVLPQATINAVVTFTIVYMLCAFVGWIALMLMGINFMEALILMFSSLGNVGPGLGIYGPAFSWDNMPDLAKWMLSFFMLIGRLELFSVLVLFSPAFWKEW